MRFRLAAALLTLPLAAAAQPVRVTIVNGTTQGPASADLVTLYRLGQGMEPVDQIENPDAQVTLEAPDEGSAAGGIRPFLLQATYRGVNYNAPVRLTPGETTEAAIVVYDPFAEWNEPEIGLSTWRALYRRLKTQEAYQWRVTQEMLDRNPPEFARLVGADDEMGWDERGPDYSRPMQYASPEVKERFARLAAMTKKKEAEAA